MMSYEIPDRRSRVSLPNKGMEPTPSSVRSFVAPASGRSSCLAFGLMNHDRKRAMAIIIQPEAPPLRQDASGALRVGSSRVLVELVIRAFQDGATPEAIAQRYPTAT